MTEEFTLLEGCLPVPPERVERYSALGYYRNLPLDFIILRGRRDYAQRIAVVCGSRRVSYSELAVRVERRAAGFLALGLRPLDRVVLHLPNVYEFVEAFFALQRIGVIPIMALPGHRKAELSYFVCHTGAVMYVGPDIERGFDFRKLGTELRAECPSLRHIVIVGDPLDHIAYSSIDSSASVNFRADARQVALLQLSGGSTGTPKLIARTHDDYICSVVHSVPLVGLTSESRYLAALPAAHNFTLSSAGILGALWCGASVVMARAPSPDIAFRLLADEHITIAALVPALARAWLDAAQSRQVRFPALDVLQVGGARLDNVLAKSLVHHFGCRLQQVYGMAEGLVNYTRLDDSLESVCTTQGRPMVPEDEVRIVDGADRDVSEGEVGQLLVRGPYTIVGYYRASEHNQLAFTSDGFYRTGDLVRRTPEGDFVVVGRVKEQINRAGEKVAPVELEERLLQHPGVQEVAVVGQADRLLGERIVAFLVLRAHVAPLTQADLARFLRDQGLATFKVPDRVIFRKSLPRTSVGKIDKSALTETLP
jgi:2,3-dihydroxybenzoate-AMP ligase